MKNVNAKKKKTKKYKTKVSHILNVCDSQRSTATKPNMEMSYQRVIYKLCPGEIVIIPFS